MGNKSHKQLSNFTRRMHTIRKLKHSYCDDLRGKRIDLMGSSVDLIWPRDRLMGFKIDKWKLGGNEIQGERIK